MTDRLQSHEALHEACNAVAVSPKISTRPTASVQEHNEEASYAGSIEVQEIIVRQGHGSEHSAAHEISEEVPAPEDGGPRQSSLADLVRTTTVDLMSITATSSAFPESFGLTVSPYGQYIVAFSSRALYVVPTEADLNMLEHCSAYKLRRKPLSVAISDHGHLAVLWNSFHVETFQCGRAGATNQCNTIKKIRSSRLNIDARGIVFSPSGELLAAGSQSGVEIVGLTLPEGSDRRQIQCNATDSLQFSPNQKSLLATSSARRSDCSTLLSISIDFEQAMLMDDGDDGETQPIGKLWTSQLIFPDQLKACQGAFFPASDSRVCEQLLAFDKDAGGFGCFDTVLKKFTGKSLLAPDDVAFSEADRYDDALLAVSNDTSQVAMVVSINQRSEIWVYHTSKTFREEDEQELSIQPTRRLVVDAQRDDALVFISSIRWLEGTDADAMKLVILTHSPPRALPEDIIADSPPAVSGRFVIFDFSPTSSTESRRINIKVDLDQCTLTDALVEEQVGIEQEVAIARRRTQAQRNRPENSTAVGDTPSTPAQRLRRSSSQDGSIALQTRARLGQPLQPGARPNGSISDANPGISADEPYTPGAPRPQFMLTRAATVAQHAPSTRTSLRSDPNRPLEFRREIPHESDADNWVPPPPPYSAAPDNDTSLPIGTIPGLAEQVLQGTHVARAPQQPANGMRSRVSQVMSGFQLPAFVPPQRPIAQLHYADPTRAPGPPANVSMGSRNVRQSSSSMASTSTSSRLSRHSSLYTPRSSMPLDRPLPRRPQTPPSASRTSQPVTSATYIPSSPTPQLTIDTSFQPTRANAALPVIQSAHSSTNSRSPNATSPNSAISARPSQSLRARTLTNHTTASISPVNITPTTSSTSRLDLDRPLPSIPDLDPPRRGRFIRSSKSHDRLRPSTSAGNARPSSRGWRSARTPQTFRPSEQSSPLTRQATSSSDQEQKKEKCIIM